MSSFASFSSRTKRRKLAAAVETFRLSCDVDYQVNDSINDINLSSILNEPVMLQDNQNDIAHVTSSSTNHDDNFYHDSNDSSDENLDWPDSNQQAFERELEECNQYMVLDDDDATFLCYYMN